MALQIAYKVLGPRRNAVTTHFYPHSYE